MVIPRIPFPYCVIHFLVLSPPIDYRFLDAGKVPTSYIECIAVAVTFNLAYAGSLIDLHGLAIKGAQISISWFFFDCFDRREGQLRSWTYCSFPLCYSTTAHII